MSIFIYNNLGELWVCEYNKHILNYRSHKFEELYRGDKSIKEILTCDEVNIIYDKNGNIFVYGKNYSGLLGIGYISQVDEFTLCLSGSPIKKIIYSNDSIFVHRENGDIYAWGYNGNGQLGLGHNDFVGIPQLMISDITIKDFNFKNNYGYIYMENGDIYTWSAYKYHNVPTVIANIKNIREIFIIHYQTPNYLDNIYISDQSGNLFIIEFINSEFRVKQIGSTLYKLNDINQIIQGNNEIFIYKNNGDILSLKKNNIKLLFCDKNIKNIICNNIYYNSHYAIIIYRNNGDLLYYNIIDNKKKLIMNDKKIKQIICYGFYLYIYKYNGDLLCCNYSYNIKQIKIIFNNKTIRNIFQIKDGIFIYYDNGDLSYYDNLYSYGDKYRSNCKYYCINDKNIINVNGYKLEKWSILNNNYMSPSNEEKIHVFLLCLKNKSKNNIIYKIPKYLGYKIFEYL
jgi:hypothetical protein